MLISIVSEDVVLRAVVVVSDVSTTIVSGLLGRGFGGRGPSCRGLWFWGPSCRGSRFRSYRVGGCGGGGRRVEVRGFEVIVSETVVVGTAVR